MTRSRGVRLLEVEPDLGAALSEQDFEQAQQQLVVAWTELAAGPLDLRAVTRTAGAWGEVLGMLIIDGAVTHEVRLLDRACTRLLVAGDLVLFDGDSGGSLQLERDWSVPQAARVAVLDHRLLAAGARWPALLAAMFERAAKQDRLTLTQQAISQLPRVEERLLAFFWMVADRRGQVREDGVHVTLPITHEALGRMIGARRPTVSLGLSTLSDAGLLTGEGGRWKLSHASLDELAPDADAGRPAIPHPPGRARVLVVGPRALLEGDGGHDVIRVPDGAAAVAALNDPAPQVVVVDAAVVRDDGAALASALRADPGPRVILVGEGAGRLQGAAHERVPEADPRRVWDLVEAQLARSALVAS